MIRNPSAFDQIDYDLVVVGGGIFGVAIAWDAASRGLRVALLEKGDFGHATSANHFKMVHGGIRYVQHADVVRIRESVRERRALLRIAPHLVSPLPILIPTYGHGMKGKEVLATGMRLYDLIAADRNRGIRDPSRRIPSSRVLSTAECLEIGPALERRGLTGGALFSDAQVYNPPRLALAFVRSAVEAGANVANYVEVKRFLRRRNAVVGVVAEDVLTGDSLEVRGKVVINAAGPWADSLLQYGADLPLAAPSAFSRDAYFVVDRPLLPTRVALAVMGRTRDPDALLSRPARHLFLVPWRDCTLVGVWHVVHQGGPETFSVTRADLAEFTDEINEAYPSVALTPHDVSLTGAGLTLFGANEPGAVDLSYGKRSRLLDHRVEHGVAGLITVVGVRATVARGVAQRAVDLACEQLGRRIGPSETESRPLRGGDIEDFEAFLSDAHARRPGGLDGSALDALARNHGSAYGQVLARVADRPELEGLVEGSTTLRAEVVHAVREEMAVRLSDVVFRRTDLGTGRHPGTEAVRECAELMGSELGWERASIRREVEHVEALFLRASPGRTPAGAGAPRP